MKHNLLDVSTTASRLSAVTVPLRRHQHPDMMSARLFASRRLLVGDRKLLPGGRAGEKQKSALPAADPDRDHGSAACD